MLINEKTQNDLIDPDPFILAGVCLQASAVILQLVQIAKAGNTPPSSVGALQNRDAPLDGLENALRDFDRAIERAERVVRRGSAAPDKEVYEVKFRISLGILNLEAKNVQEFHNALADTSANLANLTRWIGHIMGQDPALSAELGEEIHKSVSDAADRLNEIIEKGGPIEAVLREAKLIRDALANAILRHRGNS